MNTGTKVTTGATATTHDKYELPPLPLPRPSARGYDREHLEKYGMECIEAALQSLERTAWINTLEHKAEALWTAAGEDRHEAMKDLLHHARIGVQSQDREDAERYRAWRKAVASQNGNFLRLVSNELPDWDEGPVDEEKIDAAIDHARCVEGDGE